MNVNRDNFLHTNNNHIDQFSFCEWTNIWSVEMARGGRGPINAKLKFKVEIKSMRSWTCVRERVNERTTSDKRSNLRIGIFATNKIYQLKRVNYKQTKQMINNNNWGRQRIRWVLVHVWCDKNGSSGEKRKKKRLLPIDCVWDIFVLLCEHYALWSAVNIVYVVDFFFAVYVRVFISLLLITYRESAQLNILYVCHLKRHFALFSFYGLLFLPLSLLFSFSLAPIYPHIHTHCLLVICSDWRFGDLISLGSTNNNFDNDNEIDQWTFCA